MKAARETLRQAGVLLVAACVPAIVAAAIVRPPWSEDALREGEITLSEALRQPAPLWIDARSAADFSSEHVPGALPLNEDHWAELIPAVLQQWHSGQVSIVYCSSRGCQASHEVATRLKEFDLGPIYVLKGGWEAWKRK